MKSHRFVCGDAIEEFLNVPVLQPLKLHKLRRRQHANNLRFAAALVVTRLQRRRQQIRRRACI